MTAHGSDWPVIKTPNLETLVRFYHESLGFSPPSAHGGPTDPARAEMWLAGFHLTLLAGLGGLQHEPSRRAPHHPWSPPPSGDDIILMIPVPEVGAFRRQNAHFRRLEHRVHNAHDISFLYLRDSDGNCIAFFHDFHGDYAPTLWSWTNGSMGERMKGR